MSQDLPFLLKLLIGAIVGMANVVAEHIFDSWLR
jgi:hypothetical protein